MVNGPITTDEVRRIAHLARLTLTDDEVVRLSLDLGRIIEYVSRIAELELSGDGGTDDAAADGVGLREDVIEPGVALPSIEPCAPAMERRHFVVPQVVGP